MTGSRKRRSVLELGHDAFLDIVANLVGILIILVVVLGAQSTSVIETIQEQVQDEAITDRQNRRASDKQLATLAQSAMRAAAAQADSDRLERSVKEYDAKIEIRHQQRGLLMDLLAEAKTAWQAKKADLDQQQTRLAERHTELKKVEDELARLAGERTRLEQRPEDIVAVQHLPTPMAKTVFGDEIHFRLKGNLLSVVPVEKLVAEIRRDFERVAPSSRNGQMNAAVGPVRGYVAKYKMEKDRQLLSRGGQVQMATRIQLVGMTVEPLREPHGQPIEIVLSQSSQLDVEIAGRDPGSTAITVWVYPDSFAAFRKLKEHLYARGFATAARPLPDGYPISGGPQGSRSRAQ